VDGAGVTRYAIAKTAGLDHGAMCRFMAGKTGLTLVSVDALADVLGLDLVARRPVRVLPKQKAGRKPRSGKDRQRVEASADPPRERKGN